MITPITTRENPDNTGKAAKNPMKKAENPKERTGRVDLD